MPNHVLSTTEKGSQTIFLNSKDAEFSISDAEKFFYLNQTIIAPPGYRLLIGLNNLTIPNTMFNINSTNNTFSITTPNSAGTINNYTLDVGNYTGVSLAAAINAKIGSTGDNLGTIFFNDVTDNDVFSFTFDTTRTLEDGNLASKILGFTNLPKQSTSILGLQTINATNTCNLSGVTNIYVRIRNLSLNNLDSRGQITNVIANVINNTNYGGFIFYQPSEVLYYLINENILNHLDIELTDQNGDILELNGSEFNLTLTIHFTHQRQSLIKNSLLDEIREKNKINEEKKSS